MKIGKIREMSDIELDQNLKTLKKELFNLRFQLATRQLKNTARVREVKKDIAKILTIQNERVMSVKAHKEEGAK